MLLLPRTQAALSRLVIRQGSFLSDVVLQGMNTSPKHSPGQTLTSSSSFAQLLFFPSSRTEREGHLLHWDKSPQGFLTLKRGWSSLEYPFQNHCISRLSFSSVLSIWLPGSHTSLWKSLK